MNARIISMKSIMVVNFPWSDLFGKFKREKISSK